MVISTASFVLGSNKIPLLFFDLQKFAAHYTIPARSKCFLKIFRPIRPPTRPTDKSSNKQYRQNPVGHISHERVGIFLTVAGEQVLVVSVTRHNDGE